MAYFGVIVHVLLLLWMQLFSILSITISLQLILHVGKIGYDAAANIWEFPLHLSFFLSASYSSIWFSRPQNLAVVRHPSLKNPKIT